MDEITAVATGAAPATPRIRRFLERIVPTRFLPWHGRVGPALAAAAGSASRSVERPRWRVLVGAAARAFGAILLRPVSRPAGA